MYIKCETQKEYDFMQEHYPCTSSAFQDENYPEHPIIDIMGSSLHHRYSEKESKNGGHTPLTFEQGIKELGRWDEWLEFSGGSTKLEQPLFKKGDYIHSTDQESIIKISEDVIHEDIIFGEGICDNNYFPIDNTSWARDRETISSATPEQIAHLDACIEAGEYVDAPEVKKDTLDRSLWTEGNVIVYGDSSVFRVDKRYDIYDLTAKSINLRINDNVVIDMHWGVSNDGFRKATEEEIQWLEACERFDKFIDKATVVEINEITDKLDMFLKR